MYDKLGSTRRVGKYFGVSNGTICYWMKKYGLPRVPKLYMFNNNSGRSRRGELYMAGHPFIKNEVVDMGLVDDKYKVDLLWRNNKVDVKTCHYKYPNFRIKVKRHQASYYFCLYYNDKVSELIPVEVWIFPARIVPHSGIRTSLTRNSSKYHKYKLSLVRDKKFSSVGEYKYNKQFEKKYSKYLSKRGDKNG